jgi:hypothetical protein
MIGTLTRWTPLLLAVGVIHLILIQPNHPGAMTWGALRLFPLELPVLLITLILGSRLPGYGPLLVRVTVTLFLNVMPLLKLADYATFVSYARGFNLVLDLHLLPAAWNLTSGSIGVAPAALLVLAMACFVVLLAFIVWWATGQIMTLSPPRSLRPALAVAMVPAVAMAAADIERGWAPFAPPGDAFTARLAVEHAAKVAATRGDLIRFRDEAARDAFADLPRDRVLEGLRGHDVMMLFVESYGRSTLENPRYAPTIRDRLETIEDELAEAGLAMQSAWLTAPMIGGQSWLAHASILSGLWIDNQRRYQALIASPRRSLLRYAADAGWRTVGVMPAITLAWPEAEWYGYEGLYVAADLGYEGLPFNWVTMPDQFTLKAFERFELAAAERRPVFAEIALISSHAPWTPVPQLVDWGTIAEGRVFDEMASAGDPPDVVWRDRDRVRDQFLQAVDYSLEVIGSFANRHSENAPLLIVLGDHEPAAFVSEAPESFDVPVHVIGPPHLLEAVADWNWSTGLVPTADAPVWAMSDFRDRFLDAFSNEQTERATSVPPPGGAAWLR